jgi:heat shock protein HslJ
MKKAVILGLLLAGCAAPTEPVVDDALSGTRWSLVSIGGSPILVSTSTSMQFEKGRLSGSDGCNRYSTTYTATEKDLRVGPNIANTRMACARPIMEEATTFIEMLGRTAAYQRDGERMTLLDGSARPLANFQRLLP